MEVKLNFKGLIIREASILQFQQAENELNLGVEVYLSPSPADFVPVRDHKCDPFTLEALWDAGTKSCNFSLSLLIPDFFSGGSQVILLILDFFLVGFFIIT